VSASDYAPLVALLLALAPSDWVSMRMTYRYDAVNAASDIMTFAVTTRSNKHWVEVGNTSFEIMDLFDAYREKTHPGMAKPWTSVTLTVQRGNDVPVVDFGYEPLNLLDRSR
jgi:hypothetical protein